jgi:hypothetical protein
MALWQFITLAVLIGALLVCAIVIARRLGLADARLTRIEATLLAKSGSIDSGDVPAAEVKPEVSDGKEVRGNYLTIRDLRARSEQLSSGASPSSSWSSFAERRKALKARDEPLSSPDTRPLEVDSVPTSLEGQDALVASSEPPSLPTMEAVSEESAATILESPQAQATSSEPLNPPTLEAVSEESAATSLDSHEAPATNSEQQSPPGNPPPSDDAAAKKELETVLFLRNQRRRRRARLGF